MRGNGKGLSIWSRSALRVPARVLLDALWLQWRIVLLPWQALVFWLSCCTEMLVKFLTMAGAPPVSHRDKAKVRRCLLNPISASGRMFCSTAGLSGHFVAYGCS